MSKYERSPNHGAGPSEGRVTVKLNAEEHSLLRSCVELEGKSAAVLGRAALMANVRCRLRRKGMLEEAIKRARASTERRMMR